MDIKILITFAQISQSLPWTMPFFTFPQSYTSFLDKLGVVNFNFLSLLRLQCVMEMDYRYGVVMTFFIPTTVIAVCYLSYACGRRRIHYQTQSLKLNNKERKKVVEEIFDITDFDSEGGTRAGGTR